MHQTLIYCSIQRIEVETDGMMQKAGYIRRCGWSAIDNTGNPWEILEVRIHGATLAIRYEDLVEVLSGGMAARVERIGRNWMDYIGGLAGLAQISKSGKAVNINLLCGDMFTVSLDSLRAVIDKQERFATVAEVPTKSDSFIKNRLISEFSGYNSHLYRTADVEGGVPA
jgi:hypothetical protein